jgi:hypothetical protein
MYAQGMGHSNANEFESCDRCEVPVPAPQTRCSPAHTADSVLQACARVLLPLADRIETITYDNGKEFASHAEITTSLGSLSYFAKPYITRGNVASTNTPTAY